MAIHRSTQKVTKRDIIIDAKKASVNSVKIKWKGVPFCEERACSKGVAKI